MALLKSDFVDQADETEESIKAAYESTPDYRKPAFVFQLGAVRDRIDRNIINERTQERDDAVKVAEDRCRENERLRNEIERIKKLVSKGNNVGSAQRVQNIGNRKRKKHHLAIKAKKAMKRARRR